MAVRVFEAGGLGLSWWSTLDAAWTNVTLFAERTLEVGLVRVAAPPERLSLTQPAVVAAADHLADPHRGAAPAPLTFTRLLAGSETRCWA